MQLNNAADKVTNLGASAGTMGDARDMCVLGLVATVLCVASRLSVPAPLLCNIGLTDNTVAAPSMVHKWALSAGLT